MHEGASAPVPLLPKNNLGVVPGGSAASAAQERRSLAWWGWWGWTCRRAMPKAVGVVVVRGVGYLA